MKAQSYTPRLLADGPSSSGSDPVPRVPGRAAGRVRDAGVRRPLGRRRHVHDRRARRVPKRIRGGGRGTVARRGQLHAGVGVAREPAKRLRPAPPRTRTGAQVGAFVDAVRGRTPLPIPFESFGRDNRRHARRRRQPSRAGGRRRRRDVKRIHAVAVVRPAFPVMSPGEVVRASAATGPSSGGGARAAGAAMAEDPALAQVRREPRVRRHRACGGCTAAASRRADARAAEELLEGRWEQFGALRTDLVEPDWFLDPTTAGGRRRATTRSYRPPRRAGGGQHQARLGALAPTTT